MVTNDGMNSSSFIPIEWAMGLRTIGYNRIADYVKRYQDNMTMRNVVSKKTVIDPAADIDLVLRYNVDNTEEAKIMARGSVATPLEETGKMDKYTVLQIGKGFKIYERDLKKDPETQARKIDICTRLVHRLEDMLCILGNTDEGVIGLAGAALKNPNGQILPFGSATVELEGGGKSIANNGPWDGSGTNGRRDIYDDIREACVRVDPDFGFIPAFLLGNVRETSKLFALDSERQPFADNLCSLFGKNRGDYSWVWRTNLIPDGVVYVIPKDMLAAEFAIQSELQVNTDYPIQPGRFWYIDLTEWVVPIEVHRPQSIVRVATT